MFLSSLLIDVGNNPDRPRPGHLWLRNIYHVHQRLSMAFPTAVQREQDPQFLSPFEPRGFQRTRFLFRVDNAAQPAGARAIVLVQSDSRPDWQYAFQNARVLLAAPPQVREYNPQFAPGEQYRFRVHMNLSKKSNVHRKDKVNAKGESRTEGKRIALIWKKEEGETPDDVVREWFGEKAARCGFAVGDSHLLRLGWVMGQKTKAEVTDEPQLATPGRKMRFRSALIEGTLTVADEVVFAQTVASGIGSAKAFGFGLLSVVPKNG